MAAPIALTISVGILSVICLGFYDYLTHFEENGCEMTYMYEYPKYVNIELSQEKNENDFPHYSLYIYGEGDYANQLRGLHLKGIPVLFIPGNAGSHKQVRSLGSVALRMSERINNKIHFNYFVADFNEGGVIARALFTLPDFDSSLANTIITQATPHQRPVAAVDVDLYQFYKNVNNYWRVHASTSLRHVTVVSTGGAYRDIQVRYGLTVLDGIVTPDRAISVSTTAVPKAWVSTDHLCSVWCRQMVLLTKRAMFDIVDRKSLQVSTDPELRMKVFRYHFVSNNGLPDYLTLETNRTIILDSKIKWEVKRDKLWKYSSPKVSSSAYFAIPFPLADDEDSIFISSNLYVRLKDIERTNSTYVIIMVMAGEKKVDILVDHYDSNVRHLVYQMPNVYDTIISYPISATDGAALLKIANASSFYSLHLAGLSLPTNVYSVIVTPNKCRKHNSELYEGSILRLNIPWSHEDVFSYASYGKEVSLAIKLQTGRPADHDWRQDASEPHLEMFLHPYCHYRLKLVVATQEALGQGARFYALLLPGFMVAVLFLSLRSAILAEGKGSIVNVRSEPPYSDIQTWGKPYYIVPAVMIGRYLMSLGPITKLLNFLHLPKDDTVSLREENIFFSALPMILYTCAWVMVYLHAALAFHMMKALSYVGFLLAVVPKGISERSGSVELVVIILALSLTFLCGTLGLLLISALLILKTLSLMHTITRKLDTQVTHRQLSILFPVTLLVNLQTLLSLTPLVIWMKLAVMNNSLFHRLTPDPSQTPALVTCIFVPVLIYANNLSLLRFQSVVIGWSLYCLSVVTMLFATVSLYRLPSLIAAAVLAVTLPHIPTLLYSLKSAKNQKGE
ncbi:hypothetical protein Btru_070832 [Bulinus truncatus]|nr:hypothetical protein Btru_070832 [Bulinus truncatus]